MAKLFANRGDPDQTPCSAPSDLGLHCLPITLLGVSGLQWVRYPPLRPKHNRWMDGRMDGLMDGHENSIPHTNTVCGRYDM